MNLAHAGLGAAVVLGLLSAVAALLLPRRIRPAVVGAGVAAVGAAAVVAGAAALSGQVFSLTFPELLPLSGVSIGMDPLGGLFVAVTGGVAVAVGVYGIGYARHGVDSRPVQAVLPLFVVGMLLVPTADNAGTFLACWEWTALTSLLLVLAEHQQRAEVVSAGRWYAVMTHLGLITILAGLSILVAHAPGDAFPALRTAARQLTPVGASAVFLATLTGFASKAGIVPLHAWLPRAHPEAPSHVSALMSAAMVNLGVYGIIRVGFDLFGGGHRWWWLLVMALGACSAGYGILQAAMSTDLKRLLGYSTTENMGLILMGIGAAGLFTASGDRILAGLALSAALLHLINHAAFKTLLFLSAGSVLHATGTRDLDELGGLRARLPATTAAFGLGALAASALPPGTAFISEWLLLQALIHGFPASGVASAIVMPVAVAVVALTAGLAVVTFVKAFGVGFLARPRGDAASTAAEGPASMIVGMSLAGAACVALALVPSAVLPAVAAAGSRLVSGPAVTGSATLRLIGVTGSLSPPLLAAALLAASLAVAAVPRWLAARRTRREARLWDCGAGPLSARMEYTATSFAEPLQRVFASVVVPEQDVEVTRTHQSTYLVQAVQYRQRVEDRIERHLYRPVLFAVDLWGRAGRGLATGSVHRYLGYGFATLCGLLMLLAVTW
jgi:formate hydrogenlyase subunit 3/multisubunit Na+/H+ antiporter MnhD subunit